MKVLEFKTYVRPILKYAYIVWNPFRICDINNIENVQSRFTKKIIWTLNLSNEDRLTYLKLDRLEMRRILFDATLTFNIIKISVVPFEDFYATPPSTSTTTRSSTNEVLYAQKFRLDCRKFNFCNRSTLLWNKLPLKVKHVNTVREFLKNLETFDLKQFLKGRI